MGSLSVCEFRQDSRQEVITDLITSWSFTGTQRVSVAELGSTFFKGLFVIVLVQSHTRFFTKPCKLLYEEHWKK